MPYAKNNIYIRQITNMIVAFELDDQMRIIYSEMNNQIEIQLHPRHQNKVC